MRVWIDMTNSPHVLFFRPLIRLLEEDGHEVRGDGARVRPDTRAAAAARDRSPRRRARHGGAGALGKARALAGRLPALRRFAKPRGFDVALAHGSHELTWPPAASGSRARLRTTTSSRHSSTSSGCGRRHASSSRKRFRPSASPASAREPPKLVRYPGIKEEYYLADFEPDPAVVEGVDPAKVLVVVRTPPEVAALPPPREPALPRVLERLGRDECVHAVVLPRTAEQRETIRALGLPSLHVPEHAVDAQSLIALADLVVSAGGTMNREAVALGTPVYTTFAGRLGAVDALLIADGRLRPLTDANALELRKRDGDGPTRVRRDPRVLLRLLLSAQGA